MPNPPPHPTYTTSQLKNYFTHISLPPSTAGPLLSFPLKSHSPIIVLRFLSTLLQHQICHIPFENLSLHYSQHHSISLHADLLYNKFVEEGRGGYCMENNTFFGCVLRSLGFRIYSAGARVNEGGASGVGGEEEYNPWSHMVNIVTLGDGKKYMLDVGFGGNGPIKPLLLDPGGFQTSGIEPAHMRLVKRNISHNVDEQQRLWVYEHRNDDRSKWVAMYCFTELEFLPQDFEMMNFWTSKSRKTWFSYKVVVVRMVMEEEGIVVGTVMLTGGEVKRRIRGETELLVSCKTEVERVEALKEWFGIELREYERAGIVGLVTELKG